MPPAAKKPAGKLPAARKRNRKRKRRAASSSSSDSSSESESDGEPVQLKPPKPPTPVAALDEDSSSSESESDPDSDSDEPIHPETTNVQSKPAAGYRALPSPSPPPAEIPSFLPESDSHEDGAESREQLMKERFRKFWMASVADGFKDDLEEIRKESTLGTSRLGLLIDSLASGADVFASDINEMEVVLEK